MFAAFFISLVFYFAFFFFAVFSLHRVFFAVFLLAVFISLCFFFSLSFFALFFAAPFGTRAQKGVQGAAGHDGVFGEIRGEAAQGARG